MPVPPARWSSTIKWSLGGPDSFEQPGRNPAREAESARPAAAVPKAFAAATDLAHEGDSDGLGRHGGAGDLGRPGAGLRPERKHRTNPVRRHHCARLAGG